MSESGVTWCKADGGTPHRRRSALGEIGVGALARLVDRFGMSVGFTPSPAVKRRCGIRLDPGGHRHAGDTGPASMSSLGRWPSLDCWLRRGRSAPSARWRTRRGKRRPTRHRPGHR
jgi:hypothetical protein